MLHNKSLGAIGKPNWCISLYTLAHSSNIGLLYLVYPLNILLCLIPLIRVHAVLLAALLKSQLGISNVVNLDHFKKPWEALRLFISHLLLFNHC